jgi:hypothetical protein
VHAYVAGAVRSEIAGSRAAAATGLDEGAWQAASAPYLWRMLATGRYPTLAEVVTDAAHPGPEATFRAGLDTVLDGIAQRMA